MKRQLLSFFLLVAAALIMVAKAENYPYRSDALWVTVPNHADWNYRVGQQAEVEVMFLKYGVPRDGELEYAIGTDLLEADQQGTVQLRDGRCTIKMCTAKKPCFRDLRLKLRIDGQTYSHHVKVGFSPELIKPFTQLPKDFQQYWQQAKDEAKKYPLKYTIEPYLPFTNEQVETFLVKLNLDSRHHSLYGYLMKPRGAKPGSCPVVLTPPGAGVKTIMQAFERTYFQEKGVIRLVTEIHGLNPTLDDATFSDLRHAFGKSSLMAFLLSCIHYIGNVSIHLHALLVTAKLNRTETGNLCLFEKPFEHPFLKGCRPFHQTG